MRWTSAISIQQLNSQVFCCSMRITLLIQGFIFVRLQMFKRQSKKINPGTTCASYILFLNEWKRHCVLGWQLCLLGCLCSSRPVQQLSSSDPWNKKSGSHWVLHAAVNAPRAAVFHRSHLLEELKAPLFLYQNFEASRWSYQRKSLPWMSWCRVKLKLRIF